MKQRSDGLLIMFTGLPGTGKSTLARRLLAAYPQLHHFQADRIRKELVGKPEYSTEENTFVHKTIQNRIADGLKLGRAIMYDATNLRQRDRLKGWRMADDIGAHFMLIETHADVANVEVWLAKRKASGRSWSDGDMRVYKLLRESAEPITLPHFHYYADKNNAAQLAAIVAYVGKLLSD